MKKKENTTVVTTKSGTKVYVVGNYHDRQLRDREGDVFVNYFNHNFTKQEQQQIGNVFYDFNNNEHDLIQIPRPKRNKKDWRGQTGAFTGIDAQELNPQHEKMVDVTFTPEARENEGTITHEMIHAKKFMQGIRGNHQNERKVDFETVGRISQRGLNDMGGLYFHPKGNAALAHKRGMTYVKKGEIAKQGVLDDRVLLTGSLKDHMIGKPIENKVNKKFHESFFFNKIPCRIPRPSGWG